MCILLHTHTPFLFCGDGGGAVGQKKNVYSSRKKVYSFGDGERGRERERSVILAKKSSSEGRKMKERYILLILAKNKLFFPSEFE